MDTTKKQWGMRVLTATALGLVVMVGAFVGVKLAQADPGQPVRNALTVSGVLRGVGATTMVEFRFYRAMGDATALCAPQVQVRDGMERDPATGAFSVPVPLDQSGAGRTCPATLFHDPNAWVEVWVGATMVVARKEINPVPYAHYASQYGTPDCPVGYSRNIAATGFVVCVKGLDEVVRVGEGASAFWIDRYEAGVWSNRDGTSATTLMGSRPIPWGEGSAGDDYPSSFPDNGQWTTALYAVSRAGVPMSHTLTWFQAQAACRAVGKRLPTGEEWLAAARGTPDPAEPNNGSDGSCITTGSPRITGRAATHCVSAWGAQDMIGNVAEWTADWFAGVGRTDFATPPGRITPAAGMAETRFGAPAWTGDRSAAGWPTGPDYRDDETQNINSAATTSRGGAQRFGVPSVAVRGGLWASGVGAGVFYLALDRAPTDSSPDIGFRCVIPR